jgi:uncharacterized protein
MILGESAPASTTAPPAALDPIHAEERLALVDVLRGFALLGILLVNIVWFTQPLGYEFAGIDRHLPLHDRLAEMAIQFFGESKFYSLFSLLFGFGMAIQMGRAQARGRSFVRTYMRRLLVLLLIAAAHITLLWFGDILHAYAILGFVLLLFRNCRQRTLVIWIVSIIFVPIAFLFGVVGLAQLVKTIDTRPHAASAPASTPAASVASSTSQPTTPAAAAASSPADLESEKIKEYFRGLVARELETYRGSSFGAIARQRLEDFSVAWVLVAGIYHVIFTMFLFGLWMARAGILHDPVAHRRWLIRAAVVGVGLGLPLNAVLVWAESDAAKDSNAMIALIASPMTFIAGPTLAIGYMSVLALWFQTHGGRKALSWLAPSGRMALTTYLFQSLVFTTLCYGYGFGLFGHIGTLAGVGIALVVFAAQTALGHVWMRRFRFGPVEWLWRSLTYWHIQPMRRA